MKKIKNMFPILLVAFAISSLAAKCGCDPSTSGDCEGAFDPKNLAPDIECPVEGTCGIEGSHKVSAHL